MRNKIAACLKAITAVFTKGMNIIPATVFFFVFLFRCGGFATAQDLLILKSGEEIKVNIIEEGANVIKYREFDNPAGPLYSVSKDKVATIKYKKRYKNDTNKQAEEQVQVKPTGPDTSVQSGATETLEFYRGSFLLNGEKQSLRSVEALMEDYPEALKSFKSGRTLFKAGNGCAIGALAITLVAVVASKDMETESERTIRWAGLSISGALFISAFVLNSAREHKIRNSVTLYNSAINRPVSYKISFGLQGNGIVLAIRF